MNIPTKKLQNGFEMPVFGLGTWRLESASAIKTCIEMGITHIDTAEKYAEGHAEKMVGEAIQGYDRNKLFIVSKVAEYNLNYEKLLIAAGKSLERLKTDHFNLYLIHAPNDSIPIEETMKAMDYLLEKGLTKYIGVSNFNNDRFKEAQKYSKNKLVANQLHYNVQVREIEQKKVLEFSQQNDTMVIAWRPLQKGMLLNGENKILNDLSKKYNKTPAQIAINWLISQKNVVTLSKMSSIDHIKENLGTIGWNLEHEDIEKIRIEFPNQTVISEAVPLI